MLVPGGSDQGIRGDAQDIPAPQSDRRARFGDGTSLMQVGQKLAPSRARAAILGQPGRDLVERALADLPILQILGERHVATKPLTGARIAVLSPVTAQLAAFLETLKRLGAQIRWAASDVAEDSIIAAASEAGLPVLAREGQSGRAPLDNCHRVLDWDDGGTPNLIVDSDGMLARLIHLGVTAEAGPLASPTDDDEAAAIRRRLALRPASYSTIATNIVGLSECTARGADRLRQIDKAEGLMFPAIDASSGSLPGRAPDRSRVATDALSLLLGSQVLAQIELFSNGASYGPGVHRFPDRLKRILSDLDAAAGVAASDSVNVDLRGPPGTLANARRG